MAKYNTCKIT